MPTENFTILFRSALTDYASGNYNQAIDKLNMLEKHLPENWFIRYNMGNAKFKQGLHTNDKKMLAAALIDYLKSKDLLDKTEYPFSSAIGYRIQRTQQYLGQVQNTGLPKTVNDLYGQVISSVKHPFKSMLHQHSR